MPTSHDGRHPLKTVHSQLAGKRPGFAEQAFRIDRQARTLT
ncbi:hypothetical protein ACIQV3_08345 [Streptomyces sp. NPDC099050]